MKKQREWMIVVCISLLTLCVMSVFVFAYEWHCYSFLPDEGCAYNSKGCDASRDEPCTITCYVGEAVSCKKQN
jgi:hypothetical protein